MRTQRVHTRSVPPRPSLSRPLISTSTPTSTPPELSYHRHVQLLSHVIVKGRGGGHPKTQLLYFYQAVTQQRPPIRNGTRRAAQPACKKTQNNPWRDYLFSSIIFSSTQQNRASTTSSRALCVCREEGRSASSNLISTRLT